LRVAFGLFKILPANVWSSGSVAAFHAWFSEFNGDLDPMPGKGLTMTGALATRLLPFLLPS
jgi:hypothetical protein